MKLSHMFARMVGLVGMRVLGAGLNVIIQIVFARIFLPEDVGVIMLCMSTAAFISLFASLGYPWLAQTQLPRFDALGLKKIQHRFHGAFLHDASAAILLISTAVVTASMLAALGTSTNTALLFGCLSAPASMLLRYDSAIANTQRKFTLSYAPDFLCRPLLLLAFILIPYLIGWHMSVVQAMVAFVVVLYIVAAGQACYLGSQGVLPSDFRQARALLTRVLRTRALPLAVVAAVSTSFADIVTLLGGLLLPPSDVALLAVTIRLAAIAGFVIQVTQQFVLPDLTTALTLHNKPLANRLLLRMNALTLVTIIGGLLATVVCGRFALGLFGEHYVGGFGLLIIFMVGQSIRALGGMNQQLLSIEGKQTRTAASSIMALALLVSVSVIMVHYYGLVGMGYGVLVAECAWALLLAAQAQIHTGQRGDVLWLFAHKL